MTTNLNSYGYNFQIKVLSSAISDKIFYRRIADTLKIEYFESDANRFIFNVIKDTYEKYSIPPTKDIFKIHIQAIDNDDVLKLNVIEHLKQVIEFVGESDLDAIKDEILKFCKNQELKKAIEDSITYLELGQFDEIRNIIETASRVGDEVFSFYDYIAEFANRYSEEARNPIPTSWTPINEITQGGLSGGELGVICAGPGGGKCVGPNTEIEIQYDEIGIELSNNDVVWIKPWDKFILNEMIIYGWEIYLLNQAKESLHKK